MKYQAKLQTVITSISLLFVSLFLTVAQPSFADFQKTKIAVLDFELIGDKLETTDMGAILSEWFITSIVKSGRFDVVERAMLKKIIAEQKLSTTGIIDDSSASELGKILGVRVIISGSVLKIDNTIEINARVISVESGSIIAAENIRGTTNSDLHRLVNRLTSKIMRNFPLTGYIVKKNPKSVIIDLGLASGLAPGTEFIVYKEGAIIKHPKTGEVLDVEQILTGRIRIEKISRNVAKGKILSEESPGIEYGQLVKSVQKTTDIKAPTPATNTATVVTKQPFQQTMILPAETASTPTVVKIRSDREKIVRNTVTQQENIQAAVAKNREYRAAIFPWVMGQDGGSFTSILVSRLQYLINRAPKLSLAKSYYYLTDVPSFTRKIRSKTLFVGSAPNLAALRQYGKEQHVDIAITGTLDIVCRWSDNCQVRKMNIYIVDLVTGEIQSESGFSWNVEANEYIESLTGKLFKRYRVITNQ